jgi:fluoroquinolone resistance protein
MHIENESFSHRLPRSVKWEEHVFQYCTFTGFNEEGAHVDSIFIDCVFEGCEFYWGLFNTTTLAGVVFKNCRFRGCGFPGCRFVECAFENCDFTVDAFGKSCRFADSRWYACSQRQTQGLDEEYALIN